MLNKYSYIGILFIILMTCIPTIKTLAEEPVRSEILAETDSEIIIQKGSKVYVYKVPEKDEINTFTLIMIILVGILFFGAIILSFYVT